MRNRNMVTSLFLPIVSLLACDKPNWDGAVVSEIDELTGKETGLFRTYGPTQSLSIGNDIVSVTIGYVCTVDERDDVPLITKDDIFLAFSLPDTSVASLLDVGVARMAIDGDEQLWQYDLRKEPDEWHLIGNMTFQPDIENLTGEMPQRLVVSLMAALHINDHPEYTDREAGRIVGALLRGWHPYIDFVSLINSRQYDASTLAGQWLAATDYVALHYLDRDTLAIELENVLRFPLSGFNVAVESVRNRCPVERSLSEWNMMRDSVLIFAECVDGMIEGVVQGDSTSCKLPAGFSASLP